MTVEPTAYVTEEEFAEWRHNLAGFFKTAIDTAMTSLKKDLSEQLGEIDDDIEALFARVGIIETRLDKMDGRLDTITSLLKLVLQAMGVPIPPELAGETK
jgi:hypothetical protein